MRPTISSASLSNPFRAVIVLCLIPLLFLLTGCGVGTLNNSQQSSSSPSSNSSAQAESEHLSELEQGTKYLEEHASKNPKELTGTATAQSVGAVLPLENPQQPQLPVTVTDHQGTEVTVEKADRILALDLYGTLAETVQGLGLADHLVGRVTSTTEPSLAQLPVVTQNGHDLNAEAIIALHPDVILMDTTNGPLEITEQLRSAGLTVVHFDPKRSLHTISEQITAVAHALGVPESGERLNKRVSAELSLVQESIARVAPKEDSQKVSMAFLYVRGTAGVFFVLGQGSGADDLITSVSGIDAASEGGAQGTTPATSEALVKLNPDLILTMTGGLESTGGYEGFLARPGVSETTAGKNHRIIDMNDGQVLSFGPNTPAVLLSLAQAIYIPAQEAKTS
ncbi:heme/hemin ABC transporter substrate-binding protein [Rothia sp. P6271]|uniref:heme/hemin ABC transporter substrate-binding protein n=1 Tax=Rothia sp. P6271 TaxID=3402659 RepID=UPI003AC265C2